MSLINAGFQFICWAYLFVESLESLPSDTGIIIMMCPVFLALLKGSALGQNPHLLSLHYVTSVRPDAPLVRGYVSRHCPTSHLFGNGHHS
jgi:hypothetical protein